VPLQPVVIENERVVPSRRGTTQAFLRAGSRATGTPSTVTVGPPIARCSTTMSGPSVPGRRIVDVGISAHHRRHETGGA
jgi:hypothetical protein